MVEIKKQEIKEIYNHWRQAVITNDTAYLQQLFSEDFISIRMKGKCKNKSDELLWLAAKNIQYLYWEDKQISTEEQGEYALVKSDQTLQVLVYDLPAKIERQIILTFFKKDKKWQLQQYREIAEG